MILVLHGAKKNAGDFLIRERTLSLLAAVTSEEIVDVPRWGAPPVAEIAAARHVVIAGGPGLRTHMVPDTFPWIEVVLERGLPVTPLGWGWQGWPIDPQRFTMSPATFAAIEAIHGGIRASSVRDRLTEEILHRAGIHNTVMTGCVAWYEHGHMHQPLRSSPDVASVVFTAPARPELHLQAVSVMRLLRRHFPSARLTCTFNRGLRADEFTTARESRRSLALATAARVLGFEVVDTSYAASTLGDAVTADLHVGYRVHAHLMALSLRRPSLLLAEDGRGVGQQVSLGDPYSLAADAPDLRRRLRSALETELGAGFPASRAAVSTMNATWPAMLGVLESIASDG